MRAQLIPTLALSMLLTLSSPLLLTACGEEEGDQPRPEPDLVEDMDPDADDGGEDAQDLPDPSDIPEEDLADLDPGDVPDPEDVDPDLVEDVEDMDPHPDFVWISASPEADQTGVALDKPLHLEFSAPLAPDTAVTNFRVEDAQGQSPDGQWQLQGTLAVFQPVRYQALTRYTVHVSAEVGDGVDTLDEPLALSFSTGELTGAGLRPPGPEDAPLGRLVTLHRKPEYVLTWTTEKHTDLVHTYTPSDEQVVLEDPQGDSARFLWEAELRDDAQKQLTVGQFDEDPWEEIFVLQRSGSSYTLSLLDTVADNDLEEQTLAVDLTLSSQEPDPQPLEVFSATATAGDFDGDGRDELLLALQEDNVGLGPEATTRLFWRLVDFDPEAGLYSVSASGSVLSNRYLLNPPEIDLAAGDVDADGRVEAVALLKSTRDGSHFDADLLVLDELMQGGVTLAHHRLPSTAQPPQCPLASAALTTADADGDGADEIFIGISRYDYVISTLLLDNHQCRRREVLYFTDNGAVGEAFPELEGGDEGFTREGHSPWFAQSWMEQDQGMRQPLSLLAAGRFTGDPVQEEIFFNKRLYRFAKQGSVRERNLTQARGWPVEVPDEVILTAPNPVYGRSTDLSRDYLTRDVAVGDIDGDTREDVVLLRKTSAAAVADGYPVGFGLVRFDLEVATGDTGDTVSFDIHHQDLQRSAQYQDLPGSPRLALANVDGDSTTLELHAHKPVLAEPRLLAVLAVPPCKPEASQNVEDCSTSFSEGSAQEFTNAASVTSSVGVTVGLEWEPTVTLSAAVPGLSIKLASAELEFSAGFELGYAHSVSLGVEEVLEYATGSQQNVVLLESYVYDSYLYTILSNPEEPDKEGMFVTVNVPTGRRRQLVSQDHYNAHRGEGPEVDASLLGSRPGDFSSYPDYAQAAALLEQPGHQVLIPLGGASLSPPAGSGATASYAYGISQGQGEEFSVGLFVEASAKACTPSVATPQVCGGVSGGLTTGYAYGHQFSRSLSFSATLGAIPEEQHLAHDYATAMFAYQKTLEPNEDPHLASGQSFARQQFIVVGYYIAR